MKSVEWVKRNVCAGCRDDRYNRGIGFVEREGIDAPVTCDKCWSLKPENIVYSRHAKKWYCRARSDHYSHWLADWDRTGRKPTWRYW